MSIRTGQFCQEKYPGIKIGLWIKPIYPGRLCAKNIFIPFLGPKIILLLPTMSSATFKLMRSKTHSIKHNLQIEEYFNARLVKKVQKSVIQLSASNCLNTAHQNRCKTSQGPAGCSLSDLCPLSTYRDFTSALYLNIVPLQVRLKTI